MQTNTEAFAHIAPGPYTLTGYQTAETDDLAAFVSSGSSRVRTNSCIGSCDHCGMAIHFAARFRAADGTEFKVGQTCCENAFSGELDRRIAKRISYQLKTAKRNARIAREKARITNAIRALGCLEVRQALRDIDHSKPWGASALEECVWYFRNAGHAGCLKMARKIEKVIP